MVGGLYCFWVCSEEIHYDGSNMAEETVHFMAVGRQRERQARVPISLQWYTPVT
jgi:hypothetical protein